MITFTLETITPIKAAEYLTRNTGNRKPRQKMSEKLSRDILKGKWQVTHQSVAFDCNGRLIDGQHRLAAIIMAETSVKMYVARYDRVVGDTMYIPVDEGVKRTHADVLHLVPRQVQICNALIRSKKLVNRDNNSSAEIMDMYLRHGELIDRLYSLALHRTVKYRTSASVTTAMILTILNNPDKVTELENQWFNFVTFERLEELKPSIVALIRFADSNRSLSHRFEESVCRAMYGFDPKNWNTKINRMLNIAESTKDVEEIAKRVLN